MEWFLIPPSSFIVRQTESGNCVKYAMESESIGLSEDFECPPVSRDSHIYVQHSLHLENHLDCRNKAIDLQRIDIKVYIRLRSVVVNPKRKRAASTCLGPDGAAILMNHVSPM